MVYGNIDSLVQDCNISIPSALEMLQSCTKTSKCGLTITPNVEIVEISVYKYAEVFGMLD